MDATQAEPNVGGPDAPRACIVTGAKQKARSPKFASISLTMDAVTGMNGEVLEGSL